MQRTLVGLHVAAGIDVGCHGCASQFFWDTSIQRRGIMFTGSTVLSELVITIRVSISFVYWQYCSVIISAQNQGFNELCLLAALFSHN